MGASKSPLDRQVQDVFFCFHEQLINGIGGYKEIKILSFVCTKPVLEMRNDTPLILDAIDYPKSKRNYVFSDVG